MPQYHSEKVKKSYCKRKTQERIDRRRNAFKPIGNTRWSIRNESAQEKLTAITIGNIWANERIRYDQKFLGLILSHQKEWVRLERTITEAKCLGYDRRYP